MHNLHPEKFCHVVLVKLGDRRAVYLARAAAKEATRRFNNNVGMRGADDAHWHEHGGVLAFRFPHEEAVARFRETMEILEEGGRLVARVVASYAITEEEALAAWDDYTLFVPAIMRVALDALRPEATRAEGAGTALALLG